jgi:hypothetical protein
MTSCKMHSLNEKTFKFHSSLMNHNGRPDKLMLVPASRVILAWFRVPQDSRPKFTESRLWESCHSLLRTIKELECRNVIILPDPAREPFGPTQPESQVYLQIYYSYPTEARHYIAARMKPELFNIYPDDRVITMHARLISHFTLCGIREDYGCKYSTTFLWQALNMQWSRIKWRTSSFLRQNNFIRTRIPRMERHQFSP